MVLAGDMIKLTYLLDIFQVESYNTTLNFHGFMSIEIL